MSEQHRPGETIPLPPWLYVNIMETDKPPIPFLLDEGELAFCFAGTHKINGVVKVSSSSFVEDDHENYLKLPSARHNLMVLDFLNGITLMRLEEELREIEPDIKFDCFIMRIAPRTLIVSTGREPLEINESEFALPLGQRRYSFTFVDPPRYPQAPMPQTFPDQTTQLLHIPPHFSRLNDIKACLKGPHSFEKN